MQVGTLVTSKWEEVIGIVHQLHDEFYDEEQGVVEYAWEILWINSSPTMQYTVEDEEDLVILCQ
jgi:hypothetical protein